MNKSFLMTVGIFIILMGMFYLFMKQKFVVYDEKISSLFSVVQTMADELQNIKGNTSPSELAKTDSPTQPIPTIISVSDDSQSEDDSDSDSESNTEYDVETNKIVVVKTEPEDVKIEKLNKFINIVNRVDDIEYSIGTFVEMGCAMEYVKTDGIEYSMDDAIEDVVTDVVNLDVNQVSEAKNKNTKYSSMTVKELKKLVSEKGGPYLKTKPDLISYLENTRENMVKE